MKIIHATSESLPFIKSGGLADVVYSLSKELVNLDLDISIVLPLYKSIAYNYHFKFSYLKTIDVKSGTIDRIAQIYFYQIDNIKYYFIQNQYYFERDNIYGYDDDCERFSYYSVAIINMIRELGLNFDIIHIHDWQVSMIPLLNRLYYQDIKVHYIMTIHNLAYKGLFNIDYALSLLSIPRFYYDNGLIRLDNDISFLKTGIMTSDYITTVSNTYALEILDGLFDEGLKDVFKLRAADFKGILNGIDYDLFNPYSCLDIKYRYDDSNFISNKKKNKRFLLDKLKLNTNNNTMLISMVTRLVYQKGISLVLEIIDRLMLLDIQLVILGSGDYHYECALCSIANRYPNRVYFYQGFDSVFANQLYASSDVFLMPSYFEPCGLSQMIALKFGCLPLVREVGGLSDTIFAYNKYDHSGNGFSFSNFDSNALLEVIYIIYNLYNNDRKIFNKIVKRAMNCDYSFKNSAIEYYRIYKFISKRKRLNG